MKKTAATFGLFLLVAIIVLTVAGSGDYSPSNSTVERNVVGVFIADGSPRPPVPTRGARRRQSASPGPAHSICLNCWYAEPAT